MCILGCVCAALTSAVEISRNPARVNTSFQSTDFTPFFFDLHVGNHAIESRVFAGKTSHNSQASQSVSAAHSPRNHSAKSSPARSATAANVSFPNTRRISTTHAATGSHRYVFSLLNALARVITSAPHLVLASSSKSVLAPNAIPIAANPNIRPKRMSLASSPLVDFVITATLASNASNASIGVVPSVSELASSLSANANPCLAPPRPELNPRVNRRNAYARTSAPSSSFSERPRPSLFPSPARPTSPRPSPPPPPPPSRASSRSSISASHARTRASRSSLASDQNRARTSDRTSRASAISPVATRRRLARARESGPGARVKEGLIDGS